MRLILNLSIHKTSLNFKTSQSTLLNLLNDVSWNSLTTLCAINLNEIGNNSKYLLAKRTCMHANLSAIRIPNIYLYYVSFAITGNSRFITNMWIEQEVFFTLCKSAVTAVVLGCNKPSFCAFVLMGHKLDNHEVKGRQRYAVKCWLALKQMSFK